jgi:hypothetical protein
LRTEVYNHQKFYPFNALEGRSYGGENIKEKQREEGWKKEFDEPGSERSVNLNESILEVPL